MNSQTMPYMYFQGGIVPSHEAKVSIAANSLQYGINCFAGIRGFAVEGRVKVLRLKDHYLRLMQGAKILGFDYTISYENFEAIIGELIAKNAPQSDFYIRPFIFCSQERIGPKPAGLTFELAVYLLTLSNYVDPGKGLKLMVSSWRKFPDASLPTKAKAGGCYVNSFLATGEAQRLGCDEALMMDQDGYIVEASVANIILVRQGKVITPEVGQAALEGITLRTAMEFIREEKIPFSFERVDRSMVYTCEELLLLGTAVQVAFAKEVDGRPIGVSEGSGKICALLRNKFKELISGSHPKSQEWLVTF